MGAFREIEVTVFSAQDLRDVRLFGGRMSPYAVAWIHPNLKVAGPMDPKGHMDPKWNAKLRLLCENNLVVEHEEAVIINIELYDSRSHWDKKIGGVAFSLSELPGKKITPPAKGGAASEAVLMSLPVRRPSGHEQGTLNFSVRIGDITDQPVAVPNEDSNIDSGMSDMACCFPPFQREGNANIQ